VLLNLVIEWVLDVRRMAGAGKCTKRFVCTKSIKRRETGEAFVCDEQYETRLEPCDPIQQSSGMLLSEYTGRADMTYEDDSLKQG
jgi:hypothetical protein